MVMPSEESKDINIRLKKQEGVFFICGLKLKNEITGRMRFRSNAGRNIVISHSVNVPDIFVDKVPLVKLIIDKNCKKEILNELEGQGISGKTLF